ncbi:MAG: amidohydrolase family protein [Pseudomonadota bacterium]
MAVAFIGGTVIDGTGAAPQPETTVVVEGTKIVEITRKTEFGKDVHRVDVAGKTVMPGIIDTHVHYNPWMQWIISKQQYSLTYLMARGVAVMRYLLERGVTTARDMGGCEIGMCQAQAEGHIPGPRSKTVLTIIQATNGVTDWMPGVGGTISPQGLTAFLPGCPSPWADGEAAVRAKVREVLRYGAHFVKVANTAVPWDKTYLRPDRPCFTQAELEALVDEAHRAGTEVCCHVCGYNDTQATIEAIRAGVDLIDHGPLLDDECVQEMAKKNIWYCPMFAIMEFHATRNRDPKVNPIGRRTLELTKESVTRAIKAGVRICMGTDQGLEAGWHGLEMKMMVESGLTPMQAILASTKDAAEALKMQDLVGTLETGKEADLLVLDGDPLQDVSMVADPAKLLLVMQAGKPFSGPLVSKLPHAALPKVAVSYF